MPKFVKCALKDQKTVHIADHEVLIAFNEDEAAAAFCDWLIAEGNKAFAEWCMKTEGYHYFVQEK